SSLSDLPRLPLHGIKVDRTFVHRMGARRTDLEIVRSIVDLAEHLGLTVTAEGVETAAQRERLIAFGCDLGQGFLFAKALEPAAARALLAEERRPDPKAA
ncbi:MAG TPA: EAL domain-containing protein, partial [Acidimicrobiales bacterium]|nr:EAL domain-containing protein [Acidimicrobiales bacterium]